MNCNLPTKCRAIVALFAIGLVPLANAEAQSPGTPFAGYQPPNFAGMASQIGGSAVPGFPASPLAGGPTAARGGDFMDVSGQPIVLQASYCQSCPGGYGGSCQCGPGAAGGYGDPMAVDFGGYGEEQSGPHYFDVSAGVVFLQATELFDSVGPFSSAGVLGPRHLAPDNSVDDYEPGWEVAYAMTSGLWEYSKPLTWESMTLALPNSIRSVDVAPGGADFSLFTPFSGFGVGTLINGFDDGTTHTIDYQSDLQSTEFSYRRYWVALAHVFQALG